MNYRVFHAHKTVFDIVDPVKIPSDIYYDKSPDNPWFRSPDLTGQDITLEPISEKEAISIIASYEHLEITMKPVSEYPFE